MQTHSPAHATLARWWSSADDLPEKADTDEGAIRDLEVRLSISLPKDFRDYLLNAAPKNDHWDQETVIWWSPGRLKTLSEEGAIPFSNAQIAQRSHQYLLFADYCLWFWGWAICCDGSEERGNIALIGDESRIVASSFTEFVAKYASDPYSVM